jgi:hypothetical protein
MRQSLFLIPLVAAALAGCGHDTAPSPSPAPKASATPVDPLAGYPEGVRKYYAGAQLDAADDPSADAEVQYFQPPKPAQTAAGDAITLTGTNIGVRMRVTVEGVRTLHAGGEAYTAVDLRMNNSGITVYQGELREALLTSGDGKTRRVAADASASCSNGLDRDFRIDVGRSRKGCLLFPADGDAERLQLALEAVPAEAGGIWDLSRG